MNAVSSNRIATEAAPSSTRGAGRPKAGDGHPIDVHVGARVRLRRTLLGLSQEKLGELIGLTFQQVQKYERGANRISASRLFMLSHALDVPVSFFFDDMPADAASAKVEDDADTSGQDLGAFEPDPMAKRETLELVRAYYRIPDGTVRKRMFELVKAVGKSGAEQPAA